MSSIDWIVLIVTISFIVFYGIQKTKKFNTIKDHLKGGGSANWLTVGLSVMATQASAITFLSTPGQAYDEGMGFVQFYFGLPLAIIVICMVFIPIYHKLKVYTAYEYLEQRFDRKTRTLAAILFLVQRGLAAGITIFAPAIILSTILGWDLKLLNLSIGLIVIIYTVSGGTKAVSITQKQQMFVILSGMIVAFMIIVNSFPSNIDIIDALKIAGVGGKMEIIDFSFDIEKKYTFWSGITGGFFLALSYFGTDQSQVQRYLSGKSVKESQLGLMFNAVLKIPMQFFILLTGVMVFVFFEFNYAPVNYNPQVINYLEKVQNAEYLQQKREFSITRENKIIKQNQLIESIDGVNSKKLESEIIELHKKEKKIRQNVKDISNEVGPSSIEYNDLDYIFIFFILNYLPHGIIGLLLAVILSAAMSSTASELNALSTTTVIDIYKRNHNIKKSEKHYLKASKWFTVMWGLIAIIFASFGSLFENLIELVNLIGSIFYGTILGIFIVAFFFKQVKGNHVFYAACISQILIFIIYASSEIGYLWLNFIGAIITILLSNIFKK
jgi:SSS family solute:Na+ symporter